ncbi:MAG: hypothetical protein IGS50_23305 [Synechococcales cyanobacterium C42_A2020_086]|jgi:hypothetical protein|nr:hypothetical protein [Synechococcales cyanobacterium M58_A2018_015]MBF2076667.1 hypothetical protein [Synechococcales cyanobacterium C42_A2020_086]
MTSICLYDLAGFDGLPVAQRLFGDGIQRLAPFQSAELPLSSGIPCTVLRLCENNFRVRLQEADGTALQQAFTQAQIGQRVWLQSFAWLSRLTLPDGIERLAEIAVPKSPHRIAGLQMNCAAPGRIDGVAVLVWRHSAQGQPAVDLHLAASDRKIIQTKLLALEFPL